MCGRFLLTTPATQLADLFQFAPLDDNSDIFKKILDDDEFSEFVRDVYLKKVYEQLRSAA